MRLYAAYWLTAAVMRAMRPGSKWDAMLILQGAQGIDKSSLFETLAYDRWHTDYVPFDAKQREWEEAMSGYWILECSELKGLKGARLEAINNRLASRKTTVRRAYGYGVFAGTTNDAQPLSDPTGLRRYWMMGIDSACRRCPTRRCPPPPAAWRPATAAPVSGRAR